MNAARKYEEFHGRRPRATSRKEFHIPKSLVYLGEAVAVEYLSDKLNGGGDGQKAVYRHKFSPGAILCMDERSKGQLYILGSKIYVNDRGIVR